MSNSVFSQFCLDAEAAALTVMPSPNRIFVGHYEFYSHQEFYQELHHVGFELFIGSPKGKASLVDFNGDYEAIGELLYTLPNDVPASLIPVMNMQASLVAAWATYGPWTAGSNRSPVELSWDDIEYKFHEKPFVLTTKFVLHGRFLADQAATPVEAT